MKKLVSLLSYAFLLNFVAKAQPEWMFFHAADAVSGLQAHDGHIWASSGSGLYKINLTTGERTVFNSTNSDMPGHVSDDIVVEASGELWMAGSNYSKYLTRFNGTDWQTWTAINGQPIQGGLHLIPGVAGGIWIYGFLTQPSLLFYENGSFTAVPPPANWSFMDGTLSNIAITSNQHVWVQLRDVPFENFRLGEFDGTNWTLHDITAIADPNFYNSKLHADSQNNLYLLDGDLDGSTILKYDGQTWTEINASFNINDFNNSKHPMYTDAQNNFWVGLWNNTFARYDGQSWTTIDLASMGLTDGHPDGLTIDDDGNWWFMYAADISLNNTKSLYRYNGTQAEKVDLSNSRIASNLLRSVLVDPFQNKWATTYKELVKFDGNAWGALTYPPYSNSNYVTIPDAADKWGNLWLSGLDNFIGRHDGLAFTKIDAFTSDGIPFSPKNIVAAKDGTVYLATGEGEIMKIKNGEVSYMDSLMYNDVNFGISYPDYCFHVALSPSDQLWSLGLALHRLDGDSWTEIPLWQQPPFSTNALVIDPQGRAWVNYGIGSPGAGYPYQIYNGNSWQYFNIPFENRTLPVWDSQNNLWMGGTSGLYKYDGSSWTSYNIYNSELPSNYVIDLDIDQHDNLWLALENAGLAVFNENGIQDISAQPLPVLAGTIFRDLNANQQNDPDDLPLVFHKTLLLPDSVITFSNFEGGYQYRVPEGDYEVQYLPIPNWHTDAGSTASHEVLPLGPDGEHGLDFRISPEMEIRDAEVLLTGGFPRCNFEVSYWLHWRNTGTMAETGSVRLSLDPKVGFLWSSSSPTAINGNELTWQYSDMLPSESRQVYLQLQMPDELATDSTLLFTAIVARNDAQAGLIDLDTSHLEQTVLCAFDPNDKLAQPTGEVQEGQSLLADALDYTIRFQNTGNDTAFTIVIRDTLDAQFDPNTVEVLAASHPMSTRLQPNGTLEFRFANILLPDSTTNEPASHGFVRYRVKTRAGLPNQTEVSNKAYIYFDLNQPIVTNTTVNELVDDFVATREVSKVRLGLTISPNPSAHLVHVALTVPVPEAFQLKILDAKGTIHHQRQVSGLHVAALEVHALPSGVYWIVLENDVKYGVGRLVKP